MLTTAFVAKAPCPSTQQSPMDTSNFDDVDIESYNKVY